MEGRIWFQPVYGCGAGRFFPGVTGARLGGDVTKQAASCGSLALPSKPTLSIVPTIVKHFILGGEETSRTRVAVCSFAQLCVVRSPLPPNVRPVHSNLWAKLNLTWAELIIEIIIWKNNHKKRVLTTLFQYSTIVFEEPNRRPLLRLAWNKQDYNYLATFAHNSNEVLILDIRFIVH